MTKEQEKISAINKQKAWDYFVSIGEIPEDAKPYQFVLHHIDPSWRHDDIERYIQWNIEDLVVMDYGEHTKLHLTGYKFSESRNRKISEARKGIVFSDEHRKKLSEAHKGKPGNRTGTKVSDETKEKIRQANLGKHHPEETKQKMKEAQLRRWAERKKNDSNQPKVI